MKLSIVIVSWNVKKLLEKCLKTLFEFNQGLDFEVFVVDNASSDESAQMVKSLFPGVKVIENDKNLGFAAANNQAILEATGEYVLLLNPDTEFLNNHALDAILGLMDQRTRAGVAGLRLLNPDLSSQASVRAFPGLLSQIGVLLKIHHLFPKLWFFKKYFLPDFDYRSEASVDQVMGAFFLIRRELLNQIGPLDKDYFYWFEEVDYCFQAKKRGWEIQYFPQVEVIHHGGASFKQVLKPRNQKIFNQSLFHFFHKNYPPWQAWLLAFFFPLSLTLSSLSQIASRPRRSEAIAGSTTVATPKPSKAGDKN
jgi:GT2 family glycosyltransferase